MLHVEHVHGFMEELQACIHLILVLIIPKMTCCHFEEKCNVIAN